MSHDNALEFVLLARQVRKGEIVSVADMETRWKAIDLTSDTVSVNLALKEALLLSHPTTINFLTGLVTSGDQKRIHRILRNISHDREYDASDNILTALAGDADLHAEFNKKLIDSALLYGHAARLLRETDIATVAKYVERAVRYKQFVLASRLVTHLIGLCDEKAVPYKMAAFMAQRASGGSNSDSREGCDPSGGSNSEAVPRERFAPPLPGIGELFCFCCSELTAEEHIASIIVGLLKLLTGADHWTDVREGRKCAEKACNAKVAYFLDMVIAQLNNK